MPVTNHCTYSENFRDVGTDWLYGCNAATTAPTLMHRVVRAVINPDGTVGGQHVQSGAHGLGCVRKSFDPDPTVPGWIWPEQNLSVHVRQGTAEAFLIQFYDRAQPGPPVVTTKVAHGAVFRWEGGVPALAHRVNLPDEDSVTVVQLDALHEAWWRVAVGYRGDGDVGNVRNYMIYPGWPPTPSDPGHGTYLWGAQVTETFGVEEYVGRLSN